MLETLQAKYVIPKASRRALCDRRQRLESRLLIYLIACFNLLFFIEISAFTSNFPMSKIELQVAVKDLEIGMYVSRLDRPWLETPFMFQGFAIEEQDDIEQLQRHCRHVFVDTEQSDAAVDVEALQQGAGKPRNHADGALSLPTYRPVRVKRKKDKAAKARSTICDEPADRATVYTNIGEVRQEMAQAQEKHGKASTLVREIMDKLASGGKLDVKAAREAAQPIVESVMRNQSAMAWLVRMRQTGDYLYNHSVSSAIWAVLFARHIGLPKDAIDAAGLGAMLLDIGKTRVPRQILERPGPLTDEEMMIARSHVQHSVDILNESGGVDPQVVAMVRTHHERHDGSGYPQGLAEQQIPILGRIAGIVDYYDAATSKRPYADAVSSYDCLRTLNKLAGTVYQPAMIEQFVQSIGFFPPGTLVQLNDKSVAVVVAQNRRHRLKPEIILVLDPEHSKRRDFPLIDLQMQVKSRYTNEELYIDRGLEPGSFGIDPAEFFL